MHSLYMMENISSLAELGSGEVVDDDDGVGSLAPAFGSWRVSLWSWSILLLGMHMLLTARPVWVD